MKLNRFGYLLLFLPKPPPDLSRIATEDTRDLKAPHVPEDIVVIPSATVMGRRNVEVEARTLRGALDKTQTHRVRGDQQRHSVRAVLRRVVLVSKGGSHGFRDLEYPHGEFCRLVIRFDLQNNLAPRPILAKAKRRARSIVTASMIGEQSTNRGEVTQININPCSLC